MCLFVTIKAAQPSTSTITTVTATLVIERWWRKMCSDSSKLLQNNINYAEQNCDLFKLISNQIWKARRDVRILYIAFDWLALVSRLNHIAIWVVSNRFLYCDCLIDEHIWILIWRLVDRLLKGSSDCDIAKMN